jgi:transposase-like protein
MIDTEVQERFVTLRSQGWSFARISQELNVSKPTLIKWSRQYQYDIQNLRAVELEALVQKWIAPREETISTLGQQLQKVEAELASRDIAALPTARLFSLAASLRSQIRKTAGEMEFTIPTSSIPTEEYVGTVQDWTP